MTDPSPLDRLREVPVPSGAVGLSWLGQAGFILRSGTTTALMDPFLSTGHDRDYPSGLLPGDATGIDLVLCTHEHVDHFDAESAPAIAAASPQAVFVVPTPIVDMVTEAGIAPDRVVGAQPGDALELAGLRIRAVPALHGVTMQDAYGFGEDLSGGLIRFLGFVVDAGGVRLYHAGDTIHYAGMEDPLRDLEIDVAMLPINGRDAAREARGIVGNLSEREAAWLAAAIGAEVVLPMHYDLFARNRGYPEWLVESVSRDHPGTHVLVPTREAPFVWSSTARTERERPR
jgi:L-ascorbate metabolism protein UlaG (beta-lactamase superfamily)